MDFFIDIQMDKNGKHVAYARDAENQVRFHSESYENRDDAQKEVEDWFHWSQDVIQGKGDCIYYIVAVPHDWAGSRLIHSHPYVGLRVKIGFSKHPEKRVRELQTGSMDKLILHALEPGDRSLERERHVEFADHRRIGEWFICSQALANHILRTWHKYRVLPPEHQQNVLVLLNRIKVFRAVHDVMEGPPDLVNPPLDVPWFGKVFLDLTDLTD